MGEVTSKRGAPDMSDGGEPRRCRWHPCRKHGCHRHRQEVEVDPVAYCVETIAEAHVTEYVVTGGVSCPGTNAQRPVPSVAVGIASATTTAAPTRTYAPEAVQPPIVTLSSPAPSATVPSR